MASSNSNPAGLILSAFNAFDQTIALDPHEVFGHLNRFTKSEYYDCIPEANLSVVTVTPHCDARSFGSSSSQESSALLAASVGIEGAYAAYSGLARLQTCDATWQSASRYYNFCKAEVHAGSVKFFQDQNFAAIRDLLDPKLITDLDGIKDSASARHFTDKYGTHLVLGVNLGGMLCIEVTADTQSVASRAEMTAHLKAEYDGVFSIKGAVDVATAGTLLFNSNRFGFSCKAIGGDISALSDLKNPQAYSNWQATCTRDSVCGISKTVEFWELIDEANVTAREQLKLHVELQKLLLSFRSPSVFTEITSCTPGQDTSCHVAVPEGFKIIGGGACVNRNSSNFLTGSYPKLDGGTITSWVATSHDISTASQPNDTLAAYAIAIYDPADLVDVKCTHCSGSTPYESADTASVSVASGYTLTCGGIQTIANDSFNKFLCSSYPDSGDGSGAKWVGAVHDYKCTARNVCLTAFAVGISSKHLAFTSQIVSSPTTNCQGGTEVATVQRALTGGGVSLEFSGAWMNLVQQSYPSGSRQWQEYNKDTDGIVCFAKATAYAIQVTAELPKPMPAR